MDTSITAAVAALERRGVRFVHGLRGPELEQVEAEFGFRFAPDHRDLLSAALPVGGRWVDWRDGDRTDIRRRLRWPLDGALFDVEHDGCWPRSWGSRPSGTNEALDLARRHLAAWPRLVPLYSHRYLPAAPAPAGSPVFSVRQTDVVYYGRDLTDYLRHEFGVDVGRRADPPPVRVPVWSDLAEGLGAPDL